MKKGKGFYLFSAIISFVIALAFLAMAAVLFYFAVVVYQGMADARPDTVNDGADFLAGFFLTLFIVIPIGIFVAGIILLVLAIIQISAGVYKAKITFGKHPTKKLHGMIPLIVFDFIFLIIFIIIFFVGRSGNDEMTTEQIEQLFTVGLIGLTIFALAVVFDIVGYSLIKKSLGDIQNETPKTIQE
ncbi:MAG: hypothetical protein LBR37_04705 [Erysipelotrichaceae bacterium]|jgi:amino acid transporter|nr:hypothetical protein [Erysipelotrichaceae bacterium]